MSSLERLRVGILGWGEIARYHYRALQSCPGTTVSAIWSRRPADLPVPGFASLDELLPSVDAVSVALPNHLHAAATIHSLRRRKAVFVEKPLCILESELQQLETELAEPATLLQVGYRLRWSPRLQELREAGPFRRIRVRYRTGIERLAQGKEWTRRLSTSGGAFLVLGVHALDLARWLAQARGEGLTGIKASASTQDSSADYPLLVELTGRLPEGPDISAVADLRGNSGYALRVEVATLSGQTDKLELVGPEPGSREITEYRRMFRDFTARARTGAVDPSESAEILQTHRELLAARRLTTNHS